MASVGFAARRDFIGTQETRLLMHSPATGEVMGLRSASVDTGGETRAEIWDPQ